MKLSITLSPPNLFWFLPDNSVHVSVEKPGPIEVDFLALTKEYQKLVILGGRSKSIELSIPDTELVETYNGFSSEVKKPIVVEDKYSYLSAILNKSNNSIKKEIGLIDDVKSLKILFQMETSGQNRDKIKSIINSKLEYAQELIAKEIELNTDNSVKVQDELPEVEESEIVERVVPLDGE